jgi:hypothetical protein
MKSEDVIQFIALLVLIVVVLAIGPLLLIWALNTLFPVLAIPYELSTWAAALILQLTVSNIKSKKKES